MQRLDRLHLLVGRKHPTLEFDCSEAIFVDHSGGLSDDGGWVEGFAPGVGLGPGMRGPLVEQVGTERHCGADRPAQQIGHRPPRGVALHVQAGHLEGGEDPVDDTGRRDHAGQARAVAGAVAAEPFGDHRANRVEREHVQPGDRVGGRPQPV